RAQRKPRAAATPFTVPDADALPPRLDAVLDAIYVAYGEAHLTDEAVHLGRVVLALLPDAPEALGLLALMLHLQARKHAGRGRDGAYVPLTEQDPERWTEGSWRKRRVSCGAPARRGVPAASSSRRRCSRRMRHAARRAARTGRRS